MVSEAAVAAAFPAEGQAVIGKLFTDAEASSIQNAVAEAEKHSACEIVPLVVFASDPYIDAVWRCAITICLLSTSLFLYLLPHAEIIWIIAAQIFSLVCGMALGWWIPYLHRFFLHKSRTAVEVHQRAVQAFFEHRVHRTKQRTGILIFVSLFERRAEILCDEGIAALVPQATWKELVDRLSQGAKHKELAPALCEAIRSAGSLVARHFPHEEGDTNELGDSVIVEKY